MNKLISGFTILFVSLCLYSKSFADEGDLFIQVELNTSPQGCSIMKATPIGQISQFISNAQILNLTGDTSADCDDTGLAVGLDGKVYFSEDESDNIFVVNQIGQLGIFITNDVVNSIVPETVDWDNGMAISPVTGNLIAADEDNEAIFEFPTNVPTPITNTNLIKILADEDDFNVLTNNVDLEGGIAVDFDDNIYITNDSGTDAAIFKLTAAGDLSILCSDADIEAVIGQSPDLDVGAVFGGMLYVAGDNCDCVLAINTVTCDPRIVVTEEAIEAATGSTSVDLEGGICIDSEMNLYMGDDGGDDDDPNILFSPFGNRNNVSIFVSDTQVDSLYASVAPGSDPQFRGSCGIEGGFDEGPRPIPTLSEWGLIAMAFVLGLVGFMVIRKRAVRV